MLRITWPRRFGDRAAPPGAAQADAGLTTVASGQRSPREAAKLATAHLPQGSRVATHRPDPLPDADDSINRLSRGAQAPRAWSSLAIHLSIPGFPEATSVLGSFPTMSMWPAWKSITAASRSTVPASKPIATWGCRSTDCASLRRAVGSAAWPSSTEKSPQDHRIVSL